MPAPVPAVAPAVAPAFAPAVAPAFAPGLAPAVAPAPLQFSAAAAFAAFVASGAPRPPLVGPPLPVVEAFATVHAGDATVRAGDASEDTGAPAEPPQSETHAGPAPRRRRRWVRDEGPRPLDPSLEDQVGTLLQSSEGVQQLARAVQAIAARASFAEFFRQAWAVVEPSTELVWNWHITLICTVAQAVFMDWLRAKKGRKYYNLIRNVIFNVPPGSSKPVHVDGMIQTRERGLIRIGDALVGEHVLTHRGRYRRVLAVHEQGVLPTLEFTTERGKTVRVAGDHPMLTQRGWVEAAQVTTRDVLAEVYPQESALPVLRPDAVMRVAQAEPGECRCLTVEEDSSFSYQGVAVHNSKILSVSFQAWCWLYWPGMKFIALSVNEDAAMRDARATRDLVRSKWYQESFAPDWTLKGDQDAVSNYGNTKSGDRLSMPMKSEIIGLRGDCIVIDDANNPKRSESRDERDTINDLWDANQYNRVNDPMRSLRFGVQQRTHAADWTGHVIELQGTWSPENSEGWLHVVLPAEYDPERKFVLPEHLAAIIREHLPESEILTCDPRVEKGETIDEERFPLKYLASERHRWRGTGNYAGQMDQAPALAEGEMVQRKWFNFFRLAGGVRADIDEFDTGRPRPAQCHEGPAVVVHAAPLRPGCWDFDWVTISIDPAAKKTERGSNWGILVIAGKGGRRYVLDDRTTRGAFHEIIDIIKELIKTWHPDTILVEPKAAGPDIMDTLREQMGSGEIEMITIDECDPGDQDKERRLQAAIPYLKNGMVFLLDGAPWLAEFVKELAQFPNGTLSDRVDALSQCLNWKRPSGDDDWVEM